MPGGKAITEDDWGVIRRSMLFERLPEGTARALLAGAEILPLAKGVRFCSHAEAAVHCHIVVHGLIKIYRSGGEDTATIIAMHGPGRTFMLAESLAGGAYTANAETAVASRVLRLDATGLRARIAADNALALAMLASASVHLRTMIAHVEELKTMTGPERLIDFLINLAGQGSGRAEVSLPYEKHLIANYLGMKPESFSRALSMLKAQGVHVNRERIMIADMGKLRRAQRMMQ